MSYVGEGHGDLYKAPTMGERKGERLGGESDQINFILNAFVLVSLLCDILQYSFVTAFMIFCFLNK